VVDSGIMDEFLAEATEHLANAEDDILALEQGETGTETVHRLFRALHTVKGAASFLNLQRITTLAHSLEEVVGKFRVGSLAPTEEIVEALLKAVDLLKLLLQDPENENLSIASHVEGLRQLLERGTSDVGHEPVRTTVVPPLPGQATQVPPVGPIDLPPTIHPQLPAVVQEPEAGIPAGERVSRAGESESGGADLTDHSVRISLALLDRLMNLASELVLVRNQNLQAIDDGHQDQLAAIAQRLDVVTSELQSTIMQTRMRPIRPVFARFSRIVRDLAKKLGKEVELVIAGADVELDKNIIEAIGEPLTHLIRNAVDHGLEKPADRLAANKPRRGKIYLSAWHRAGQVHIEVKDDGRGMHVDALKRAALNQGLLTPEQADAMTAREAYALVFEPGFSLASKVTDISGRGMGMDAVKVAFEKLGGAVELDSRQGEYTRLTVNLPLTLAILPALVVNLEGGRFAIPQVNIDEVVLLHGEKVYQELKLVDGRDVYWLRNKLLPVLRLSRLLKVEKTFVDEATGRRRPDRRSARTDRRAEDHGSHGGPDRRGPAEGRRGSVTNSASVVVLRYGNEQFGLLVDSVVDTEEIVVKALHEPLKACGAYAGTTVLGDGQVAMIIDVAALVELGGLRFSTVEQRQAPVTSSAAAGQSMLLFNIGGQETFALPLCLIARVEEVPRSTIERADGREYVVRGKSTLRLVRLEQVVPNFEASYDQEKLFVVILKGARHAGVLVSSLEDTVEVRADMSCQSLGQSLLLGTAIVRGRLTLFPDLYAVVESVVPLSDGTHGGPRRVLLVEDSVSYVALLVPFFRSIGIESVHASNGAEALSCLKEDRFDAVISDIEMPVMDGFEFARRFRQEALDQTLPLVAVSGLDEEFIETRALQAGFDAFFSKLNHGNLLQELEGYLRQRVRLASTGGQA
jgi:two-component system chemotaxis sensor kinase CheA